MSRFLESLFDIRHVYLMRTSGRYKIGIAGPLEFRRRMIDESTPGRTVIVHAVKLIGAAVYEQILHDKFSRRRYTWTGSGRTEYFRLSSLQVWHVIFLLEYYRVAQGSVFLLLFYILFITIFA